MKNDKKSSVESCQVGEREESLKIFEKVDEQVKSEFLKKRPYSRCLIDRKTGSIN